MLPGRQQISDDAGRVTAGIRCCCGSDSRATLHSGVSHQRFGPILVHRAFLLIFYMVERDALLALSRLLDLGDPAMASLRVSHSEAHLKAHTRQAGAKRACARAREASGGGMGVVEDGLEVGEDGRGEKEREGAWIAWLDVSLWTKGEGVISKCAHT